MPLPTLPSKLGDMLSADEYSAKAKPSARGARKQPGEAENPASRRPNLVAVPSSVPPAALVEAPETSVPRSRRSTQTAALLKPAAVPVVSPVQEDATEATATAAAEATPARSAA